ncbi:MAG: nucleotidyltransferase domain-containing protein [Verrucomicrobiota bacterium]
MPPVLLRPKDLAVLRATLRRFPSVRAARVFGSRATGTARRASDLDLAIQAPEATTSDWLDLCDAMENAPLIYELDLVREERTLDPRLREKIECEGVTVYPEEAAE